MVGVRNGKSGHTVKESNMDRKLNIGSQWLHFKGVHIATIIAVATHTETNEELVVYECYDNNRHETTGVFARPKYMFLSEVDKEKYPNAKQEFRFEKIN